MLHRNRNLVWRRIQTRDFVTRAARPQRRNNAANRPPAEFGLVTHWEVVRVSLRLSSLLRRIRLLGTHIAPGSRMGHRMMRSQILRCRSASARKSDCARTRPSLQSMLQPHGVRRGQRIERSPRSRLELESAQHAEGTRPSLGDSGRQTRGGDANPATCVCRFRCFSRAFTRRTVHAALHAAPRSKVVRVSRRS